MTFLNRVVILSSPFTSSARCIQLELQIFNLFHLCEIWRELGDARFQSVGFSEHRLESQQRFISFSNRSTD